MPRKARVEFAGAVYHLLDRGDRREANEKSLTRSEGHAVGRLRVQSKGDVLSFDCEIPRRLRDLG